MRRSNSRGQAWRTGGSLPRPDATPDGRDLFRRGGARAALQRHVGQSPADRGEPWAARARTKTGITGEIRSMRMPSGQLRQKRTRHAPRDEPGPRSRDECPLASASRMPSRSSVRSTLGNPPLVLLLSPTDAERATPPGRCGAGVPPVNAQSANPDGRLPKQLEFHIELS